MKDVVTWDHFGSFWLLEPDHVVKEWRADIGTLYYAASAYVVFHEQGWERGYMLTIPSTVAWLVFHLEIKETLKALKFIEENDPWYLKNKETIKPRDVVWWLEQGYDSEREQALGFEEKLKPGQLMTVERKGRL